MWTPPGSQAIYQIQAEQGRLYNKHRCLRITRPGVAVLQSPSKLIN